MDKDPFDVVAAYNANNRNLKVGDRVIIGYSLKKDTNEVIIVESVQQLLTDLMLKMAVLKLITRSYDTATRCLALLESGIILGVNKCID